VNVEDNGKGMVPLKMKTSRTGNGLPNMEARALESGWEIHWKAEAGQGTKVIIESVSE
jgi:signal transduction histidine kinase